ncbi:MAG: DUF2070 family protein [Archaeoglobales archaeon]|nr:DUF2070 family protein [Archaeoglobales archaeon]
MMEQKNFANAEKLYNLLFSIPKNRILIPFTLGTLLLSTFKIQLIKLWLAVFLVQIVCIKIAKLHFNLRRSAFLSSLLVLMAFPFSLTFDTVVGIYFFFLLVMYFCSEIKKISSAASLIPFLFVEPKPETILIIAISFLLLLIFLRILDFNTGKVNSRKFVENFVLHWLTSKPDYLENLFEDWGETRNGRVRKISFGCVEVLTTDFHPGPFRNVGGARMVEALSQGNKVYLHSSTSHRWNPTSSNSVAKILKAAQTLELSEVYAGKPIFLENNRFEAFCFPFSKFKLIFVSGKEAIDDFEVRSKEVIIDCHNAYKSGYDVGEDELREIESLVKMAENLEFERVEVKSGFVKISASSESICNYLAAILLDYGEKYAIVIFDSNNIEKNFRKYVEEKFSEIGYTAIVTSTDNHAKTGIRTKTNYKPAGACEKDWEYVEKLVKECKKAELKETKVKFGEALVDVKVFGGIIDDSTMALKRSGTTIATFLAFNFLCILLSIALEVII